VKNIQDNNMSGKARNHQTALNPTKQGAPLWAKYRTEMHNSFPSPFKGANDSLADSINQAIRELDHLKPDKVGEPAFLGKNLLKY
jgi:hypothetical protein